MRLKACIIGLLATLWALTGQAAILTGRDGDTLTVLDAHDQQHKVRLFGIDAPERGQP